MMSQSSLARSILLLSKIVIRVQFFKYYKSLQNQFILKLISTDFKNFLTTSSLFQVNSNDAWFAPEIFVLYCTKIFSVKFLPFPKSDTLINYR